MSADRTIKGFIWIMVIMAALSVFAFTIAAIYHNTTWSAGLLQYSTISGPMYAILMILGFAMLYVHRRRYEDSSS